MDLIEAGKFLEGGKPLTLASWREKAMAIAKARFSDGCFDPLLKMLATMLDEQFASASYHGYLTSSA